VAARKQALRGATKARLHSPLLKGKTRSDEIAKMADDLGTPLLPWQRWLLDDMMRIDAKGNYIRKTTLLLVARQNGKSHLGRMRVIWGLFYGGETKHLIMSSNRATALMTFREIAWIIENAPHLKAGTKAIRYANGGERIELLNGATLDLVSDTRDSSRGRTADFLWIDEVREISKDGYTAAIPTTRARPNSQTLLTSNAGDAFSETLNTLRERALSAPPKSFGFYEYSAPQYCKITDRNGWAMANPALSYTITEESLEEAEATSDATLQIPIGGYTVFGFDVSPSRRNASLVAGQIMGDGRIGVGILQTWESQVSVDDLKIAAEIKGWADQYRPKMICYDKYTTQSIAERLANAGQITQDVSGQQFYQACSDLLDGMVNGRVVHNGQEELIKQMNNCAAKTNDSSWRIVKRKSAGDVSAPISLAMVVSMLLKPQQVAAIYTE
jgi:phage terminase large subunit-like protein